MSTLLAAAKVLPSTLQTGVLFSNSSMQALPLDMLHKWHSGLSNCRSSVSVIHAANRIERNKVNMKISKACMLPLSYRLHLC